MANEMRQAYEGYQVSKYKRWEKQNEVHPDPEATKSEEQKAFESYLTNYEGTKSVQALSSYTFKNIDDLGEITLKGNGYFKISRDTTQGTFPPGIKDWGMIKNTIDTPTKIYQELTFLLGGPDIMGKTFTRILEPGRTAWVEVPTVDRGNESNPSATTYTKSQIFNKSETGAEIVNGIKRGVDIRVTPGDHPDVQRTENARGVDFNITVPMGAGPGPGPSPGGGGTGEFQLPLVNSTQQTVEGDFGCSLINYRQLSRTPQFGVNGKILYTKGKRVVTGTASKHYAGSPLGFTGIKKNVPFVYNTHWIKYPQGGANGSLVMQIHSTDHLVSQDFELKTAGGVEQSSTQRDNPFYGVYYLDLGSDSGQPPAHYEVEFEAWYGAIKPDRLDRKFVFKKHKGVELLANGDTSKRDRVTDIYKSGTLFDTLEKNLGVVSIKDCNVHRAVQIPHVGTLPHEHFIVIEIPDDALIPTEEEIRQGQEQAKGEEIGKKLLCNTLAEIPLIDEQSIVAQNDTRPYLVQHVAKMPVSPHDIQHQARWKWCWFICVDVEYIDQWIDLLMETQIVYPLKEKQVINLPRGGYAVNMSDGSTIYTYNYTQIVKGVNEDSYEFKASTTGYPNIKIKKSNIISIAPIS